MSNNAFTSNLSNGMWLTTIPHRISGFKESYAWITKFRVSTIFRDAVMGISD